MLHSINLGWFCKVGGQRTILPVGQTVLTEIQFAKKVILFG